ncbi:hypothetical protein CEXT_135131 [Caerostris extrusa]|uniref:Uncharacterized protein n=1 Tax=Caerostris extrusa TaxID=172846 RepID=A0AAV4P0M1_CAEEX|nr:hypothetical protein CEXT_135131 [Caerostris extrusa]
MGCPLTFYTTCRKDIVPRFWSEGMFLGFQQKREKKFNGNQITYTQRYPEIIKSSVVLFPLVEKLRIVVYHEDCLQHLKKLKHLCELEIYFYLVLWVVCAYRIYFSVKRGWPTAEAPFDCVSKYHCVYHASRRCHEILFKCGTFGYTAAQSFQGDFGN